MFRKRTCDMEMRKLPGLGYLCPVQAPSVKLVGCGRMCVLTPDLSRRRTPSVISCDKSTSSFCEDGHPQSKRFSLLTLCWICPGRVFLCRSSDDEVTKCFTNNKANYCGAITSHDERCKAHTYKRTKRHYIAKSEQKGSSYDYTGNHGEPWSGT